MDIVPRSASRFRLACLAAGLWLGTAGGVAAQATCIEGDRIVDGVVPYVLAEGTHIAFAIPKPLTTPPATNDVDTPANPPELDAEAGLEAFVDPKRGGCLACHQVASLEAIARAEGGAARDLYGYQGTVGPSLDAVGDRYTRGELRLIIADPERALPTAANRAKPAYYRTQGLIDVPIPCQGLTLLKAADIENIVAFLATLKAQ